MGSGRDRIAPTRMVQAKSVLPRHGDGQQSGIRHVERSGGLAAQPKSRIAA
jgi:hypothetical protein